MKGYFITFEGGEGAGKSSLIISLHAALIERGYDVMQTRAPGGTGPGAVIRDLLLHPHEPMVAEAELFLYLADRAQHVSKVIRPALDLGKIVLCDRFNDSTVAYQGAGRGFGTDKVEELCRFASANLVPNLTIYLDLDPAIGLERIKKAQETKDQIEAEDLSFHYKIREAFHQIAKNHPNRFQVIDASAPKEAVFEKALRLIDVNCFAANR